MQKRFKYASKREATLKALSKQGARLARVVRQGVNPVRDLRVQLFAGLAYFSR